MNDSLPSNPILDEVRREARVLLHGLERREVTALRRYYSTDPLAGLSHPRLEDAQYVIAHEYGYSSWRKVGGLCNRDLPCFPDFLSKLAPGQ